jgi:acyl-CoA reductase-like NAD-dependent aldehyde dehydrogenase
MIEIKYITSAYEFFDDETKQVAEKAIAILRNIIQKEKSNRDELKRIIERTTITKVAEDVVVVPRYDRHMNYVAGLIMLSGYELEDFKKMVFQEIGYEKDMNIDLLINCMASYLRIKKNIK